MKKKLIEMLKKQTADFKVDYLKKTEEWAKGQLQRNIERRNQFETMRGSDFPSKNEYHKESKWYWSTPQWNFTGEFIVKMIKKAEDNYEVSVDKLAWRIMVKRLNIDALKVNSVYLDPNLNVVITDGVLTIKAFTIGVLLRNKLLQDQFKDHITGI